MNYIWQIAYAQSLHQALIASGLYCDETAFSHLLLACLIFFTHTHTHTHLFNGRCSRKIWISQQQKGRTILDSTEARDDGWHCHQLDHIQIICTSLQPDNHISTLSLRFFTGRLPFLDVQPTVSEHWRYKSTEGRNILKSFLVTTRHVFWHLFLSKKHQIVYFSVQYSMLQASCELQGCNAFVEFCTLSIVCLTQSFSYMLYRFIV